MTDPEHRTTEELGDATPRLSDVAPIGRSEAHLFRSGDEIREFVEAPLLTACQQLYEKNIRTISSSANAKDAAAGIAPYLELDYESLSEPNREIAARYGHIVDGPSGARVHIDLTASPEAPSDQITQQAELIASSFEPQPLTWPGARYTAEDLRAQYGMADDEPLDPSDFPDMYMDDSGAFWASEELYRKATLYPATLPIGGDGIQPANN